MTTLISFLGKGRLDDQRTGYQETTYRFTADFARTVPFFGLAQADYRLLRLARDQVPKLL